MMALCRHCLDAIKAIRRASALVYDARRSPCASKSRIVKLTPLPEYADRIATRDALLYHQHTAAILASIFMLIGAAQMLPPMMRDGDIEGRECAQFYVLS